MIVPLLVMGPIDAPAPALKIASPGAPLVEPLPPLPPWIVPLLVSVCDRARIRDPRAARAARARAAPDRPLPPFPPLIVPLLDRLVIVPAFDTPAPPALAKSWCRQPLPPPCRR